ncbi:MAG: hypothetical protein SGPRY_003296, partial [Prymnesium sp.]
MSRGVALLGLAGALARSSELRSAGKEEMKQLVAQNSKVILYITNGPCSECDQLSRVLAESAALFREVPIAHVDGTLEDGALANHFQ